MNLVIALCCLLTDLAHEHAVALAESSALTLRAESVEYDEEGKVYAVVTLSFNKKDSGGFLSKFCPEDIVIPVSSLPWSYPKQALVSVSGIPELFRPKDIFMLSTSTGNRDAVRLKEGGSISGKMPLTRFFNKKFLAQKTKPNLQLSITAQTSYKKRLSSNLPLWVQARFGPHQDQFGSLAPYKHVYPSVTFKDVAVQNKSIKQRKLNDSPDLNRKSRPGFSIERLFPG